jgi:Terminase RNaseH-like domain
VLADRSLRDAPAVWGRAAVEAYREFDADRIIAEENFGGEMVRFVIRAADANVPVRMVTASRGKTIRAEPVSALYEQGLVHHVGRFAALEDQLCAFTTAGYRGEGSPDHADALVFAISELMLKDAAPILEFYRRQAESRRREPEKAGDDARSLFVRLKPLAGVSAAHGMSGAYYGVDAEGFIDAKPQDVTALLDAGFERVVGNDSQA